MFGKISPGRLWIPLAQAIIFRCSAAKKCT
ncbi:hypothetical protein [Klebsiella phage vB_KpnS-VAC4]|uniref:Uncharacterized protein n=1 Tax=Klebsiella phage vB_KpnS-VAC4 TaxID=2864362 RepID=A0AAE8BXW1_9CAUD|nr:hypothetical protein [Klebsiella phage vB_KpnS-VAC4]